MIDRQADRLHQIARRLVDVKPLIDARDAIARIHALAVWKRAQAKDTQYRSLEPAHLDDVVAELAGTATPIEQASTVLRSGHVADAITMFHTTVTWLYENPLDHLASALVDEHVFDRELCKGASCRDAETIGTAYELAAALEKDVRASLVDAGHELRVALGSSMDVHTTTVLTRATGEGPAFGEPCGPEGLCRWDQACMPPTQTCEHVCDDVAMDPCPGNGGSCVKVAALPRMYCRRRQ